MKKKLLIIISFIVLFLIGGGFFLIWQSYKASRPFEIPRPKKGRPFGVEYQLSQKEKEELGIRADLSVIGKVTPGDSDSLGPIQILKIEKPMINDTDQDGLSDKEEKILGTNPTKRDTDQDGLDDPHESYWKTNPLDPDTDKDGILDGLEVYMSTGLRK